MMKRKQNTDQPLEKIIEIDDEGTDTDNPKQSNQQKRRSWVWNHFKRQDTEAICQVVQKNGKPCGVPIERDKSAITKNFHDHLRNVHGLSDPALVKKAGNSQIDIEKWAKNSKFVPKVSNLVLLVLQRCIHEKLNIICF
jgi:hypothetical protein